VSTKKRAIAVVAACVITLAVLYVLNPVDHQLMPKCPFKLLTGLSCPGCGFQRAIHALLHGRIAEALGYNYWLVFALPYLIAVIVEKWALHGKWQKKAEAVIEHRYLIHFYIVTFFIWFVVRNLYNI
jgi:hypothetical protein